MNTAATMVDEEGNVLVGDTSASVILELRTGNCEVFGYLGPDGGMVERREEAKQFLVKSVSIIGIVVTLPIDP